MPFPAVVDSRRRSPGRPRPRRWLTGLAALAIMVLPSLVPRSAWATEPSLLTRRPERLPDPPRERAQPRPGGPNLATPRSGHTLTPKSPIEVFRKTCLKCHDSDGRGEAVRDTFPEIPNFTDPKWQDSRSDDELAHSILKGKGKSMRPMKDKLGAVDVTQMVAFIRAFRGGKQKVSDEPKDKPAGASSGSAAVPADRTPADPPTSRGTHSGSQLFQQFCVRCHGEDGTGAAMRASLPMIPNFTDPTWQAKRSDPQMVVSVLDGEGMRMPAFRGQISEQKAHELVAYVRSRSATRAPLNVAATTDFANRFRALEQQFRELEKQYHELSNP